MPIATNGSAVVRGANNLIYVIGGNDGSSPVSAVQIYHVLTDTWTVGTPLPAAVSNESAVIDSTGRIVVIGGITAGSTNTSAVWLGSQESAPPVINSIPNPSALVGAAYSTHQIAGKA